MEYSTIIIYVLLILLIYTNKQTIYDNYYKFYNQLFPVHRINITENLTLTNNITNTIMNYINNNIYDLVKHHKLQQACIYAIQNEKKFRSVIMLSIFKQLTNSIDVPNYVNNAAMAIEYIYVASLIINDIIDNNAIQTNKNTLYNEYGIAMAQLTALILCFIAYQNINQSLEEISELNNTNKDIVIIINKLIAKNLSNLTIGQYLDIKNLNNINNIQTGASNNIIEFIHKKTSYLFELCFIISWIYANKTLSTENIYSQMRDIKKIAQLFGLIYQISDDFENVELDQIGDKHEIKNYVIHKGYKRSYTDYNDYVKQFMNLANKHNLLSQELSEIINYLNNKTKAYYN
jgi:geranylgeranyl pyrophosphate synthase